MGAARYVKVRQYAHELMRAKVDAKEDFSVLVSLLVIGRIPQKKLGRL